MAIQVQPGCRCCPRFDGGPEPIEADVLVMLDRKYDDVTGSCYVADGSTTHTHTVPSPYVQAGTSAFRLTQGFSNPAVVSCQDGTYCSQSRKFLRVGGSSLTGYLWTTDFTAQYNYDWVIETWFDDASIGSSRFIIGQGSGGTGRIEIKFESGIFNVQYESSTGSIARRYSFFYTRGCNYMAVQWNSSTLEMTTYRNGTKNVRTSSDPGPSLATFQTAPVTNFRYEKIFTASNAGTVDLASLIAWHTTGTGRLLTDEELDAHYAAGPP